MPLSERQLRYARNLVRGNCAEVLFERLAVNNGWCVLYNGFQYDGVLYPVDPKTDQQEKREGGDPTTADFRLCRDDQFKTGVLRVEVKFRRNGELLRKDVNAQNSDFVVIFAADRILAQKTSSFVNDMVEPDDISNVPELGIAKDIASQIVKLYPDLWSWNSLESE